jgi:hypothetical protein
MRQSSGIEHGWGVSSHAPLPLPAPKESCYRC